MISSILFCIGAVVLSGFVFRNEIDDGYPGILVPVLVGEYLIAGVISLLNGYTLEGIMALFPAIMLTLAEVFLAWEAES